MTRPLVLGLSLLVTALCTHSRAHAALQEHVDQQYQFAFQYPPDWTLDTHVKKGAAGEVRAVVRQPQSSVRAMASIGQVGKTLSKAQFEASANRDMAVQAMMESAVKETYERISHEIHADKMMVADKQILPSDVGIKFYISTAHIIGDAKFIIAGMHIIPFGKPYMITFTMISPLNLSTTAHKADITRVFNSFHMVGEAPKK